MLGDLSPQMSFKGKNAWGQGTCLQLQVTTIPIYAKIVKIKVLEMKNA